MMNSKKTISMCLVLAMLLSLLAGCGGNANTNSTTPPADTQPKVNEQVQSGNAVDANKTADDIESGQRSVINYAVEQDCLDFDPFTFNTGAKEGMVGLWQPLAYMIDGEVVSSIMKDYTMSDDGLTMYGEIYDYITDSEGNKITASDIVFSYEKSEELAGLGTKGFVDSFTATGDYTFEVQFSQKPGIGKLDKLLKYNVVSEKAYNEHDMHSDPVATGPYVLTEHISGYSFTLERREDYWQTDTSKISARDMANVDVVNFYVIGESAQRTIALKNGSVDASILIPSEDLDYFDASEDFWLSAVPDDLSMTMEPNCDPSRLTSDVNLRKAIFYAISNEAILESVYGGRGTALHDFCPSWAVGYNPDWDTETDNFYAYDLEKAKEYLDQSSYNGETLVILTDNGSTSTNVAQMIGGMLEQVGIKTSIDALDGTIVRQTYGDPNAWDLYLVTHATNTYWIDAINGFLTTDKTTWDGSPNFWYDMELQDMLREYIQVENATPENFEILRDYVLENALGYGIVNPLTYIVVPSWCTSVCLSGKKCMTPGGNTYLPE